MRNNLEQLERIERYLSGKMSTSEHADFEIELNSNPEFKDTLYQVQLTQKAIKRAGLRKQLQKMGGGGYNSASAVVAVVVLILSAIGFHYWNSVRNPSLSKQSAIQSAVGTANETVTKPGNFKGLNVWTEPQVQRYSIDAKTGGTLEGEMGTLIIIPEDAFSDSSGVSIEGDVEIELIEALTLDKMVLYNLTTTSDGRTLETGGMVYINATQNGIDLMVKSQKPMLVQIPTDEIKQDMMVFEGAPDSAGNMNWSNPKPLERFLVPVSFSTLDFLPEGFEIAVTSLRKESKYYANNRNEVDSIYYSIGQHDSEVIFSDSPEENSETKDLVSSLEVSQTSEFLFSTAGGGNKQKSVLDTKMSKAAKSDTINKPNKSEKLSFCGIDPLAIKAIRSKPFEQTFIATKEFETRLQALHTIENAQLLLDLYTSNLAKPLYHVDSLVALRLQGKLREQFLQFSREKHTNVKNLKIHQDQLIAYYNKNRKEFAESLEKKRKAMRAQSQRELDTQLNEVIQREKNAMNELSQQRSNPLANNINSTISPLNVAFSPSYSFQWYSLGWANIDAYLKLVQNNPRILAYNVKSTGTTTLYQWLNAITSLTPITLTNGKGEARFPKADSPDSRGMNNTYAIAIGKQGDTFYWGFERFNPYNISSLKIATDETPLEVIKQNLLALSAKNEILIKRLKTEKEELEELQRLRAEALRQYEEQNAKLQAIQHKYKEERQLIIAQRKAVEEANAVDLNKLLTIVDPCFYAYD